MESILFTNWTNIDFTWQWGKEDYNFPAGKSTYLPGPLAKHFAKHLVDREMHRHGINTDDPARAEFEAKCFLETKVQEGQSELKGEIENENKNIEMQKSSVLVSETPPPKKFCEQCDSKGGRHKATCPTLTVAPEEVPKTV